MNEAIRYRWITLCDKVQDPIRKKQFENLCRYLDKHTGYFTSPASTKYHCSWPGGLLEHSINVAENALKLNKALGAGLNEEELVIAGLFHDLGKAFIEEDESYYLVKEPTDRQKQYGYVAESPFEYNRSGCVFMTVPQKSVRLVTQYIDISDACYASILTHDGQYVDENKPYACKECSMQLILHYADSWAGFTMEGSVKKNEDGKGYTKIDPEDKYGRHGLELRRNMCVE